MIIKLFWWSQRELTVKMISLYFINKVFEVLLKRTQMISTVLSKNLWPPDSSSTAFWIFNSVMDKFLYGFYIFNRKSWLNCNIWDSWFYSEVKKNHKYTLLRCWNSCQCYLPIPINPVDILTITSISLF